MHNGPTVTRANRTRRSSRRAFTLVELLIVVAIIGVMSALALVGYRKYLNTAQSSEAKGVIMSIRGAQEAYKSEMLQYLKVSNSITTYYPNTTPDDKRSAWVQPTHADYTTGWKLLAVNPDTAVRFGYACTAGVGGKLDDFEFATTPTLPAGVPWFTVQAKNDHDHNGTFAFFGSTSMSGEIMSQNEQE